MVAGDATPSADAIRVLVIDDDLDFLRTAQRVLTRAGLEVVIAGEPVEGLAAAAEREVDVVLSDIRMPNLSGMDLFRELKAKRPGVPVVLMTAHATVDAAVAAVKEGVYDYLTKPFLDIDHVALTIRRAAELGRLRERTSRLESTLEAKEKFEDLIGQSPKMTDVFRLIDSVAASPATVLIQGESGTGKELAARAIHRRSQRSGGPFVAVNCSALTETLLESELFGHVRGAFTGAVADRRGLFEAAHGGTLFLDEIGDVPPATQLRLLRALQEGEVKRVGAQEARRVDVRVIAATNADLDQARSQGRLREDLFFRLNVIAIPLPPLRDRPEDIPLLALHFLRKHAPEVSKRLDGIAAEAMKLLTLHGWPGNVRELENAIERAVVLARGPELVAADLPPGLGRGDGGSEVDPASLSHLPLAQAKKLAVRAFERRYLTNLLRRNLGNVTHAAAAAGVDRSNFRRLLREYGVVARREPADEEEPTHDP
jgi:two-component system response regulator HydG